MERRGGDLIGAVLEHRYRVDGVIARGGMSTVYRGLDTRLDRPVAVKVMDPRFSDDRSFIDRFVREARSAAKLHHPNVVAVHDQGVDHSPEGDRIFLVMELVEGGTLRDLLTEHGELPVPLALSVLEPVLDALAAAHQAGLVHRDIKPENVLVGQGDVVKVADFGLVRAAAESKTTSDSVILGTVAYLSPEQVETGAADPRSDVYSAGVVLYEMLTGTPPFTGDTALSVAFRHVNSDVPAPSEAEPGIPPALDDLVLRCTRREASVRPPNAAAFLAELRRVRAGLGIRQIPVPVPAAARPRPAAGAGIDPPTDRLAPTGTTAVHTGQPGQAGPRGTMALSRPTEEPGGRPQQAPVDPYQRQRHRSRRIIAIWIGVIVLLALLVGGAAYWLGSGRWTSVPNVAGQDSHSAEVALRNADLVPKIVPKHDNTVPANQAVGTDPEGGSRELRGSEITLAISEGRPTVPAVAPGSTQDEASQAVRNADLVPVTESDRNQFSSTVPAGKVVGLNPRPGSQLTVGAGVLIMLSKGPQPVPLPNVVGMPKVQAFAALTKAGLKPVDGGAEPSGEYDSGQVVRTEPAADQVVSAGTQVRVVVSSSVTVPNVMGQQLSAAMQQLQSMGLVPDVRRYGPGQDGRVLTQSPLPGSRAKPGDKVTLNVLALGGGWGDNGGGRGHGGGNNGGGG